MALKKLGVPFEMWKTSDIDVSAVKSYKAIHCSDDNIDYSEGLSKTDLINSLFKMAVSSDGKKPMAIEQLQRKGEKWLRETYNCFKATHNLGSIMGIHAEDLEIEDKDYTSILVYSFPCQDISLSGLSKGFDEGSGTRSALIWEVQRILEECKEQNCLPSCLIMENVSAIHNKNNLANFNKWLKVLEDLGYKSYWSDINAKNVGIPQSRDRTFIVSFLGDYSYQFPENIPLQFRFKDYLEKKVDEKYYINNDKAKRLIEKLIKDGKLDGKQTTVIMKGIINHKYEEATAKLTDVSPTLLARDWRGPSSYATAGIIEEITEKRLGNLSGHTGGSFAYQVYDPNGVAPTLTKMGDGGGRTPHIIEDTYSCAMRGRKHDENGDYIQELEINNNEVSNSITSVAKDSMALETGKRYRIRRLTPLETWRLMNFTDEDYYKAANVNSQTQLLKEAGNAIVVNCLVAIFGQLFEGHENDYIKFAESIEY